MTLPLDPDRILALAYVPGDKRAAVEALWRLDATLGAVLATASEPMVTRIRLAWWREALERLDRELPPPEPLLQALATNVLPKGISGADLAALEDGWEAVTGASAPDDDDLARFGRQRGTVLFRLTATLLDDTHFSVDAAGARWALVDLARHSANPAEAAAALAAVPRDGDEERWPKALRPLGMLSVVALSDLNNGARGRQGSPYHMIRMMFHRATGR